MAVADVDFPTWSLLPKKETGVSSFLAKYPEYDGRGVTIAIFDSGVDPGAPGLQVTTTGEKKIVEMYDCSGAGDVDISTIVQAEEGYVTGLTGRKLKIPPNWKNPSGNYHIGVKNAHDLYLLPVKERIEKDKKEKLWDPFFKTAVADVTRKQKEFEKDHPSESTLKASDKLKLEDLKSQLEVLNEAEKKYNSSLGLGSTYDCIVFNDGEVWRACIDTTGSGDLSSCNVLGEYSKTYDYAYLTPNDQLNYAINVWDDGKILEIVTISSSHGTHVAAIAAANFPDDPHKNGVAPGAQIISLCIGDKRLNAMETGSAMIRAMIRIMQDKKRKVHVINMSYGEHVHYSNSGRVIETITDVIDKHGPVWVCSAGNDGPALSTISTPPNINSNVLIGVGAYVSPEMMQAAYSLRTKLPATSTTWTARGPCASGDPGVSVCAPGAAVTSVPECFLRNHQLMNGTSMASPHVCGVVALLLSGMIQRKLPFTPYSVKRALENTAQFVSSQDAFGQGEGLVNVERAFDHLTSFCNQPEKNCRFLISVDQDARGIYIRDTFHNRPVDKLVKVEPVFFNSSSIETLPEKTKFNVNLVLTCDQPWVSHPSHLALANMQRAFAVSIDPTGLQTGVYRASVKAYDTSCVEKGPIFRVPITFVQPFVFPSEEEKKEVVFTNVNFKPSQIQRHFIMVPENATWAVVRMSAKEKSNIWLHSVQLNPGRPLKKNSFIKPVALTSNTESVHSFAVRGGIIIEVAVAKFWTEPSESTLTYSISFHGIKPDRQDIIMQGSEGVFRMALCSGPEPEELLPSASLKSVVNTVRPTEAKIVVLSPERDRQVYGLQLTYSFHIKNETDVFAHCPYLSHLLYESEFESQLWMVFSSTKKFICCRDAYCESMTFKLDKGDYVLRMLVRHEKKDVLEKFTDKPMLISQKLSSAIPLDVYGSEKAALVGGRSFTSEVLHRNQTCVIYITPISNDKKDKVTKAAALGQYLTGTITFAKDEVAKKAFSYPVRYILPDVSKTSSSSRSTSQDDGSKTDGSASNGDTSSGSPFKEGKEKPKIKENDYKETLLDFQVSTLEKLERGKQADALYEELSAANPDKLSLHLAMLKNLRTVYDKTSYPIVGDLKSPVGDSSVLKRLLAVANTIIDLIDQTALRAYLGMKVDTSPDASKVKSLMDRQKATLVDALITKGIVLCFSFLEPGPDKDSSETVSLDEIDSVRHDILKYVDPSHAQHFLLWHAAVNGLNGCLLKLLFEIAIEKPSKDLDSAIVANLRALGLQFWADRYEDGILVRFPPAYRPF